MTLRRKKSDLTFLGIVGILIVSGMFILASVSAPLSQEKIGSPYYFFKRQVLLGILPGLILAFLAFRIPLDFVKKIGPALFLINVIFLGLVFAPKIGLTLGGATRWVELGPFAFQPSEALKLTFIIYLASWLNTKNKTGKTKKNFSQTFIAFLIILVLISALLIKQPDISTLGIIISISIVMYFLGKTPIWHSILVFLIIFIGLAILIKVAPYRARRLLVFFKPETDPMGMGFHTKQALIAIGSGGTSGVGLGMSQQKFGFVPNPMSDSIFAILAEETGFLGVLVLVSLLVIFTWQGIKIARNSKALFPKLLVSGITFWIVLQAFLHIGAMTGLLPLTGVPLPFISYGSSHLITEFIGAGLVLNASKYTN